MSEIKTNLIFAASIPPSEQPYVLEKIRAYAKKENQKNRPLYSIEKEFLSDFVLPKAEEKLIEIGIQNPGNRLPGVDEFIINEYRNPYGQVVGGFVRELEQNIVMEVSEGIFLTHPAARSILFHEIGHFVTPQVIGRSINSGFEEYRSLAWGFQRNMETGIRYGIYEEPSAAIFSLYCLDSDEAGTPVHYTISVPFFISLLTRFAEKAGLTPLEAFKEFFKAKVERDFSFQQKLVRLFSRDFVKMLNSVPEGEIFDMRKKLNTLSAVGGFRDEYYSLQKNMDGGKKVYFPGIKGWLRIQNLLD